MFCNLMNKDQLINNNQYNVVEGHKLIFLKMDPKYSKKYIMYTYIIKVFINTTRLKSYTILCFIYNSLNFTLVEIIPGIFNTLIISLNIKLIFSKLLIVN